MDIYLFIYIFQYIHNTCYIQGGHDVRYRTQCTVPDFFCTVRYGIEVVCTVFWCVRYFSGYEKKISDITIIFARREKDDFFLNYYYLLKARKIVKKNIFLFKRRILIES